MSTTLTGEVGVYGTTGDPTFATGTVPTNGDDVDAPVVITLVQRLLDFDAQLAFDVNGLYEQVTARIDNGVPILRNVASIAALKALSTGATPDGGVAVVKDATVSGSNISGVGLFVYDLSSTQAECPIPGAADAYLVVTPNSGVGRWINAAAGLGWKVGDVRFLPRGQRRSGIQTTTGPGSDVTVADSGGFFATGIAMSLSEELWRSSTALLVAANFSFKSGSLASGFYFQLEVSIDGGAWTAVPGSLRRIGGVSAGNNLETAVHIQASFNMGSSVEHAFRVTVDTGDSDTITIYRDWQMTASWHWDGVLRGYSQHHVLG